MHKRTFTKKARLLIVDDEIDMLRLLERSIGTELDWELAWSAKIATPKIQLDAIPRDVLDGVLRSHRRRYVVLAIGANVL